MRPILVTLAFLAVFPLIAQEDEQPFFTVTSSRTWGTKDKPRIQVSSWGVDALEYRLYRLREPQLFFSDLRDLHQFGGREPRPPHEQTVLERFHDWKNTWRSQYRRLLREQFDEDAHTQVSKLLDRRQVQASRRITHFTPLPLLNSQQVVSVWKQPVPARGGWSYQDIGVDNPGKGVYLLEVAEKNLRAYTILVVSDIALITKQAPGRLLTFVTDRQSGTPVSNANISILSNRQSVATLISDANGVADSPLTLKNTQNLMLLARNGDDWAIQTPYGFRFGEQAANTWRGYIYTDRPVYRPGHPVDFKAILRREQGVTYALPEGTVRFEIQDSDGNTVFEKKDTAISPFGGAWGQFTLKPDAKLGYYSIVARTSTDIRMSGGFQVEEYKKPEYEVRVTPDKPRVFAGDPIRVQIEARYYFGEPVANAKVTWVAHRSPYYSPVFWRDEDDTENSSQSSDESAGGDQTEEQTGKLDANGKFTVTVPTTLRDTDSSYWIEARVTDQGNREISGAASALAVRGNFVLNVEPDRYGYAPGQSAHLKVQARDYDGKPVHTKFHLDLQTWNWRDPRSARTLTGADGQTDDTGAATVTLIIPKAAILRANVTASTPAGRTVSADAYIWTSVSDGESNTAGQDIQIIPDQKTYKAGEVARLLIVSRTRFQSALLTVEGRNIDSPRVLRPEDKSFTVEIPVKSEYVPNFFVNVAALSAGELHEGSKSVSVPAADKLLEIEIQPEKEQYKPGEAASYNVTTKDANGTSVSAEVSLGVVDEAIYAIKSDPTPDPMKFFYGRLYNNVETESSLSYYFSGAAGVRRMQLTSLRPATALAALKPEHLVMPKVRKAFPDTAFWTANLVTDGSGRATARFDFPDSLTTWRATARGVSLDTKVGAAIKKSIVRKNLMLRLAVPRFFTQGDEVVISGIVHNYLDHAKTVQVSLDTKGLDVLQGTTQDVTVASRADAKVNWRVRPQNIANVTITGKALTDEESDALELTLPVNPQGVTQAVSRSGVLTSDATSFALNYPASAAPNGRQLKLQLAPSIAGSLFGALDYLTSFPYGCTEQIMSSFLPNVIVADTLARLKIKTGLQPSELKTKLNAGLEQLYQSQHDDGGWGWWPTDDSSVFMTAYVVAGLHQAADLGQQVKPQALNKAQQWLASALSKDTKLDPDLRAYSTYAMKADADGVWNERSNLTPFGLSVLGLLFDVKHDERAGQVATELEAVSQSDSDTAHWEVKRDSLMNFYADTSPEATAFALKLLVRRKPNSPLIPKAARWLVSHRSEGYWWNSTKQTAMVIYGLTDYVEKSGELRADYDATVQVNGRPVFQKHFTPADALSAVPEEITVPNTGSPANVEITKSGSGRLYWSARQQFYSNDKSLVDSGTIKLNLVREYFRLNPGHKDDRVVYDLQPLSGSLKTGDLLGVRLTVSGSDWRYLIAEDPIPSGAEFVSRDDLYELRDPGNWWTTYYSRREFHDDRAAFFDYFFRDGQKRFFYLLRITNPGRFKISPARAYPMYQPDHLATTGSAEIVAE